MRKVIIVQARLASSRFPGKVLADLAGKPVIAHVIDRLRAAKGVDDLCVAIPTDSSDDQLAEVVRGLGTCVTRGHGRDVLSRYIQAAYETKADVIVRATGDNALVDWHDVERQLNALEADPELDYVTTDGYPIGGTVETFKLKTLEKLDFLARKDDLRKEVTLYVKQNEGPFVVKHLQAAEDLRWPELSLSINRPEDLQFMQTIYDRLGEKDGLIEIGDVIGLLRREPALLEINQAQELAAV
jgi:spore coat polysaccharide biosynthesis protein SpsF